MVVEVCAHVILGRDSRSPGKVYHLGDLLHVSTGAVENEGVIGIEET